MEIAKKLKKVRFDSCQNQEIFAKNLGISQPYLSAVERGKKPLTIKIKKALKTYYGVDLELNPINKKVVVKSLKSRNDGYSLNDKFKIRRLELGLTQKQVALSLGIAISYYSDLECHRRKVSMKLLEKFNSIYNVNDRLINENILVGGVLSIAETLDNYKNSLTDDSFISDQDYRVMIKTIDRVKELLKDF